MFIKNVNNYIVKTKINIGTLLGCETDEEAYIVLREPTTELAIKLKNASGEGEEGILNFFKDALPKIIVDHNLMETEEKKMSKEDVASLIFENLPLTMKVVEEYSESAFRKS